MRLWDINTGNTLNVLTNHKKGIRAVKPHFQEYSFVSAASDNFKIWQCPHGEFLRNFESGSALEIVNTIDISYDDILAAGYDNGAIKLFDW